MDSKDIPYRRPLSKGRVYHFNIIYNHARCSLSKTADTQLSLLWTQRAVETLQLQGLVNSYYHDRDCPKGQGLAQELTRVIAGSEVTVVLLSPGFVRDCWPRYCLLSCFRSLFTSPGSPTPPSSLSKNSSSSSRSGGTGSDDSPKSSPRHSSPRTSSSSSASSCSSNNSPRAKTTSSTTKTTSLDEGRWSSCRVMVVALGLGPGDLPGGLGGWGDVLYFASDWQHDRDAWGSLEESLLTALPPDDLSPRAVRTKSPGTSPRSPVAVKGQSPRQDSDNLRTTDSPRTTTRDTTTRSALSPRGDRAEEIVNISNEQSLTSTSHSRYSCLKGEVSQKVGVSRESTEENLSQKTDAHVSRERSTTSISSISSSSFKEDISKETGVSRESTRGNYFSKIDVTEGYTKGNHLQKTDLRERSIRSSTSLTIGSETGSANISRDCSTTVTSSTSHLSTNGKSYQKSGVSEVSSNSSSVAIRSESSSSRAVSSATEENSLGNYSPRTAYHLAHNRIRQNGDGSSADVGKLTLLTAQSERSRDRVVQGRGADQQIDWTETSLVHGQSKLTTTESNFHFQSSGNENRSSNNSQLSVTSSNYFGEKEETAVNSSSITGSVITNELTFSDQYDYTPSKLESNDKPNERKGESKSLAGKSEQKLNRVTKEVDIESAVLNRLCHTGIRRESKPDMPMTRICVKGNTVSVDTFDDPILENKTEKRTQGKETLTSKSQELPNETPKPDTNSSNKTNTHHSHCSSRQQEVKPPSTIVTEQHIPTNSSTQTSPTYQGNFSKSESADDTKRTSSSDQETSRPVIPERNIGARHLNKSECLTEEYYIVSNSSSTSYSNDAQSGLNGDDRGYQILQQPAQNSTEMSPTEDTKDSFKVSIRQPTHKPKSFTSSPRKDTSSAKHHTEETLSSCSVSKISNSTKTTKATDEQPRSLENVALKISDTTVNAKSVFDLSSTSVDTKTGSSYPSRSIDRHHHDHDGRNGHHLHYIGSIEDETDNSLSDYLSSSLTSSGYGTLSPRNETSGGSGFADSGFLSGGLGFLETESSTILTSPRSPKIEKDEDLDEKVEEKTKESTSVEQVLTKSPTPHPHAERRTTWPFANIHDFHHFKNTAVNAQCFTEIDAEGAEQGPPSADLDSVDGLVSGEPGTGDQVIPGQYNFALDSAQQKTLENLANDSDSTMRFTDSGEIVFTTTTRETVVRGIEKKQSRGRSDRGTTDMERVSRTSGLSDADVTYAMARKDSWIYENVDKKWTVSEVLLPFYKVMCYVLTKPEMPYF